MSDPRIIVPLDYGTHEQALSLAGYLDPTLCRVKVGKELFTAAGPRVLEDLHNLGFEIFLDLKFHDIPNTVAGACRAAAAAGVWMMNVHALGGRAMLDAAHGAVASSQRRPLLIAVTVLTSMSEEDLREVGVESSPGVEAMKLAKLAEDAGFDGIVCSGHELEACRNELAGTFLRVTPGIRPVGSQAGDQKRVMTPGQAIRLGANYLVIGRPITAAPDPVAALDDVHREVMEAFEAL